MTKTNITPESLQTQYVSPDACVFYLSDAGFLGVEIDGEKHDRVILKRALPFKDPDRYICITDVDKKELGIIEAVNAFSEKQQKLIANELRLRYFCPVITQILSIKEKMGHFYFDVKVGDYPMSFMIRDLAKNIRCTDEQIILTDVDGNRFLISDIGRIDKKSRRKLEPYLY